MTWKGFKTKIWRVQNLYKIVDKQKQVTNLKFNRVQWQIVNKIAIQVKQGIPIRQFDLKFRQPGVSTFWLLWWLDETIFEDNVTTGILAHKKESLDHLWKTVEFAYNSFPEKLVLKEESAKALEFEHNNSKIFISLSIRSTGMNNIHISEWCFCENDRIQATLGAASPWTNISGESTGNGVSNDGYETYQDSVRGYNEYISLFVPWFIQEEYRLPLLGMDPKQLMTSLDGQEKALQKLMKKEYGMDLEPEQVLFRRQKKRQVKSLFPQEYPETEEDAFITSGEHFFDLKKILALLKEAREWHKQQNYYEKTDEYVCFEPPQKRDMFVMGVDTAEGSGDNSTIKIINVTQRKEAFAYKARCGITRFYKTCDYWGRQYGNALMAVEDNNTGHAVILGLQEDTKYPNLFQDTNITRITKSKNLKVKVGWHTDKFTRPAMLSDLKQGIEDDEDVSADKFQPEITLYDMNLLTECFDFVNNKGKFEAAAGKVDDMIMGSGIAFQLYLAERKLVRERQSKSKSGVIIGQTRQIKL